MAFAKPPAQCLAEPRFFTMFTGPTLAYNAAQLPPEAVQDDLRDRGEQIKAIPGGITAVQMVTMPVGGAFQAASDPRKGGTALAR